MQDQPVTAHASERQSVGLGVIVLLVRQTERKSFEGHRETGSVRRGAHGTDEERPSIRQATQAKQVVVRAIDGVAHLDIRPGPADSEPEGARVACQRRDRPVRLLPRDDRARVLAAIDELDATFEPDPLVAADHQSRLIVLVTIGAGDLDLGNEVAVPGLKAEVAAVTNKAIVGGPPEIGLWPSRHEQGLTSGFPRRRFVQPLHLADLSPARSSPTRPAVAPGTVPRP